MPSNPPEPWNLARHHEDLKLPDAVAGKSASQLSISDMETTGWKLASLPVEGKEVTFGQGIDKARTMWGDDQVEKNPLELLYAKLDEIREAWFIPPESRTTKVTLAKLPKSLKIVNGYIDLPTRIHPGARSLENCILSVSMHFVDVAQTQHQSQKPVFEFAGTETRLPSSKWPEPDFTLCGSTGEKARKSHPAEAAVNALIGLEPPTGPVSELTIERTVGAAIMESMWADNCGVFSGQNLDDSWVTKASEGKAFPDIFVIRLAEEGKLNFRPALSVAEAKRSKHADPTSTLVPNYRAQVAAALHSSMVLLALYFNDKYPNHASLQPGSSGVVHSFPEFFFFYGIYYDEKKVIFYVHFPVYARKLGAIRPEWQFHQVHLATFVLEVDPTMIERGYLMRFRLATAMLAVRRHNERLVGELSEICNKYKRMDKKE